MKAYTSKRWVAAGVATAFMTATSALPMAAQASWVHSGSVDAASIGQREPTAVEIQNEINLVQSEGFSIRVVGHFVRPSMDVLDHGRRITATNVPVVEYEVGAAAVLGQATSASVLAKHLPVRTGMAPMGTRDHRSPADMTRGIQWTANFGGNPTFLFTAHFNQSCNGNTCSNATYMVTHRATIANGGYSLRDLDTQGNCGDSGFIGWVLGSGTFNGGETTTGLSPNIICANGSTYMYFRGVWVNGSSTFTDCFNDNTACPGDYLKY